MTALDQRYAPGGDIYESVAGQYGRAGADRVWRAYTSGKSGAVQEALADLRFGDPRSTNTAAILLNQLVTDPLGAPLDAANSHINTNVSNALKAVFRNPWIVTLLVGPWVFGTSLALALAGCGTLEPAPRATAGASPLIYDQVVQTNETTGALITNDVVSVNPAWSDTLTTGAAVANAVPHPYGAAAGGALAGVIVALGAAAAWQNKKKQAAGP